jgi:site-specific DNA recombinase
VTAASYEQQINELDTANKNLILSLQQMQSTGDPEIDSQWRTEIQRRFAGNTRRKQAIAAELQDLAKAVRPPSEASRDIVDQLPRIDLNVRSSGGAAAIRRLPTGDQVRPVPPTDHAAGGYTR